MNILKPCCIDLGLLIVRLTPGVIFFIAGLNKIRGGIGKFAAGAGAIPKFMPHSLGVAYLHAVPVAELLGGVMIIVGLLARVVGLIASLMLISFMIAVTGFADRGGPHPSVVLLGVTLLLMPGAGRYSVDEMLLSRKSAASAP